MGHKYRRKNQRRRQSRTHERVRSGRGTFPEMLSSLVADRMVKYARQSPTLWMQPTTTGELYGDLKEKWDGA